MVMEMLAGDELAPDDPDTARATGFLARNWDIFNRNVWLASTVEHTSRAFLGLTIQCARCHDHKFDPISQADYYRLRAFFEPYHIRVDRVPGEPDRAKAGLPRAFDDFLDRPTFLFVRGEESRPDKSRPLRPATPRRPGRRGPHRADPIAAHRLLPRQAAVRHRGGRWPRPIEPSSGPRRTSTRPGTVSSRSEKALDAARDVDAKAAAKLRGRRRQARPTQGARGGGDRCRGESRSRQAGRIQRPRRPGRRRGGPDPGRGEAIGAAGGAGRGAARG